MLLHTILATKVVLHALPQHALPERPLPYGASPLLCNLRCCFCTRVNKVLHKMPYNALTSAILGGGVGALALVAEHGVREVLQDASVLLCF